MESKLKVLLVDDSDNDAFIMSKALEGTDLDIVGWVMDGASALDYLMTKDEVYLPHIILMDIHMPNLNGLEALKKIKSSNETKHYPVIMLTASDDSDDVTTAYENFASGFLIKPTSAEEIKKIADALQAYWPTQQLPKRGTI